jgi:uncharacterized repeat protein (TIGR04138 family)
MTMHHAVIADIVRRDPRYVYEAYEFVFDAWKHTLRMLERPPREPGSGEPGPAQHVSGRELLNGVRDLALREFGLMARTVFHLWGIHSTDDFGEIVFNLVDANLMNKTEQDCRSDFHAVFDFDESLVRRFQIQLDEAE